MKCAVAGVSVAAISAVIFAMTGSFAFGAGTQGPSCVDTQGAAFDDHPTDALYSVADFNTAYFKFLKHPVKTPNGLQKEVALYFHDGDALADARASTLAKVFKPDYFGNYPVTDEMIRESFSKPVYVKQLIPQDWAVDHIAIFRGNVFPDQMFHIFSESGSQPLTQDRDAAWKKLTENQPWLEWDPGAKSFKAHDSGAELELVKQLGGANDQVTLYRGTGTTEGDLFEYCKAKSGKRLGSADIHEIKSQTEKWYLRSDPDYLAFIKKLKSYDERRTTLSAEDSAKLLGDWADLYRKTQLSSQYGSAFFTTPDPEKAQSFAIFYPGRRSEVEKYQLSVSEITRLLKEKKIYLGVEHGQIEIAFFDPSSLQTLLNGYKPR